ncbi:hypothetical protein LXA43DRAFT_1016933 [Ganoderma leucocontextum]|nr:hypothetical protein LXA43DRAFT_1016933 [Ganoderma leucocontextum]
MNPPPFTTGLHIFQCSNDCQRRALNNCSWYLAAGFLIYRVTRQIMADMGWSPPYFQPCPFSLWGRGSAACRVRQNDVTGSERVALACRMFPLQPFSGRTSYAEVALSHRLYLGKFKCSTTHSKQATPRIEANGFHVPQVRHGQLSIGPTRTWGESEAPSFPYPGRTFRLRDRSRYNANGWVVELQFGQAKPYSLFQRVRHLECFSVGDWAILLVQKGVWPHCPSERPMVEVLKPKCKQCCQTGPSFL